MEPITTAGKNSPAWKRYRAFSNPWCRSLRAQRCTWPDQCGPTLVFMRDGKVVQQLARPGANDVRAGLEVITQPATGQPPAADTDRTHN